MNSRSVKKKKFNNEWAINEHVKAERNIANLIRHLENLHEAGFGYAKQAALVRQVRKALACGKANILTKG